MPHYFFSPTVNDESHKEGISKGVWVAIILAAIACAVVIISAITVLIIVRNTRYSQRLPRKDLCKSVIVTNKYLFLLIISYLVVPEEGT
jgi:uncharacterized RDD family membrane protein YckC